MSGIKLVIAVAVFIVAGVAAKVLFFQKHTWYEAPGNTSRVAVGSYVLAADLSAGTGHLNSAMVNLWLQQQSADVQTLIQMTLHCDAVRLLADDLEVKPIHPESCRNGAGATGPSAYLMFDLPAARPQRITLKLPAIEIRGQNGEFVISPPIAIAYYEQSKRAPAAFH